MVRKRLPVIMCSAALLIAASIVLSGCATIAGNIIERALSEAKASAKPAPTANDKPTAGECWQSTYENTRYADGGNGDPVNCASKHQLYTYAVRNLKRTHTGSQFASGSLKAAIDNDAYEVCEAVQAADFPRDIDQLPRLNFIFFVPTRSQWAKGARWVRCDVGLTAFGSLVSSPKLAVLPSFGTLKRQILKGTTQFQSCVDVAGAPHVGPLAKGARWADCRGATDWERTDLIGVPGGDGPYPSQATLTTVYDQQCANKLGNAAHPTSPRYPTKADWAYGYTVIECWVFVRRS